MNRVITMTKKNIETLKVMNLLIEKTQSNRADTESFPNRSLVWKYF